MLQTSVEIVKPGGTGKPALVISARPAPLPPSRSFMLRLPSAFLFPKKKTYFLWLVARGWWLDFFAVGFLDIRAPSGEIKWVCGMSLTIASLTLSKQHRLRRHFPMLVGPHPRSLALRRSKTRHA